MKTVLDVQHLQKTYDKKPALKNVNLTVRAGTCFGLLGPNGAGKSTTMKILTGVVEADGGQVEILGLDASREQKSIRRQVGYVPQNITLYEKLSARENLYFFGEIYGIRGNELKQRVDQVLDVVGLANRDKDAVETFSGGMKRRINIAAALIHQPKLLILDEPTVGIDPQSRNHIFEMIRSLKSQGVTIIYSTHYMEEVEALCEDVAIIDQGEVIAQGTLHEVMERYSSKAVYVEAEGLEQLPALPQVKKTYPKNGGWVIETEQVAQTMQLLLQHLTEQGWEIKALELMRPSLEDVFLSLTGTSLRD